MATRKKDTPLEHPSVYVKNTLKRALEDADDYRAIIIMGLKKKEKVEEHESGLMLYDASYNATVSEELWLLEACYLKKKRDLLGNPK